MPSRVPFKWIKNVCNIYENKKEQENCVLNALL